MTKARDLANIISGGFTADDIPNIDASKITSGSIADARIPASAVSQHAVSFDDNAIVNDLSTIALRQATNENAIAYNTNSSFVDVFQDGSGIASHTTSARNDNEYVSSVSVTTENGGTENNPNAGGWTTYSGFSFNFGGSVPSDITTWYTSGTAYNFGGHTANEVDGKFWLRFLIHNTTAGSDSNNNPKIQFGIMNSTDTMNAGQSIYNNNPTNAFWFGYNAKNGSNLYFYKGNTLQATVSKSLAENQSIQMVGDGTTLKVYHSSSTNTWYDNGADLVHTYTNFTDSGSAKRMLIGNGLEATPHQYNMAKNFSWKENMSTVAGEINANATGNFISNTITAPSSTSKMGAIITYQDNAGTNALNTDIILQLSADNGSTYSTATLTALPDFSTGIKMAKVNDLTVTAGTQLKYKISFANQSSGSKEARIRGVSLQY